MKHRLSFSAIVMLAMLLPSTVTAQKTEVIKDPDNAKWVIKASMNSGFRGDRPVYWIDSVSAKGIRFKTYSSDGDYNSYTEKVSFSFKDAYTTPPEKINERLILWTKNSKGKWVQDAEKTDNRMKIDSTKILSVVMVLDCSGSMSEDGSKNFEIMRNSALNFLDSLYRYSRSTGNIHVGVIGFNTTVYADNHSTKKLLPLTRQNHDQLRKHILGLQSIEGSGTALYYSIDQGLQLLRNDYDSLPDINLYNGSALVCFTDGKDNLSKDIKKKITNLKDYLTYMQNTFCKQELEIGGKPVLKRLVGFRGKNVDIDEWNSMVEDVTTVFCEEGAFVPITKIEQLNSVFSDIARRLIQSNMSLICQVPSAITGPVAWTIPEYEKASKKSWVGIGLDAGVHTGYSDEYWTSDYSSNGVFIWKYYTGGLNIDLTTPLDNKTYVGLNTAMSVYYCYDFTASTTWEGLELPNDREGTYVCFRVGPILKYTLNNKSAIILGAGLYVHQYYIPNTSTYYVYLGYKFKSPWYINLHAGEETFGLGVGYSILGGK